MKRFRWVAVLALGWVSVASAQAAVVVSAAGAAAADARSPGDWLDVRDRGASGSQFETAAVTAAGSKQITVANRGDFQLGQGVMLSRCNPRLTTQTLWGPTGVVAWGQKLCGKAEIRGYDGSQGDWLVLILDVAKGSKSFRWTEDLVLHLAAGCAHHRRLATDSRWYRGAIQQVRLGKRLHGSVCQPLPTGDGRGEDREEYDHPAAIADAHRP